MSATFTTALSTPGLTTNNSIRKKRTKLFFSQLYHYLSMTYNFLYSLLILPRTKLLVTATKNIPKNNDLQYYKGKTLILDLDETLVHSVRLGSEDSSKTVSPSIVRKNIEVHCEKQNVLYEVYKRPHVDFFLKTVRATYNTHPISQLVYSLHG